MVNIILIIVVLLAGAGGIYYYINSKKNQEVEEVIEKDDKTYTLEKMTAYIKQRLNEIILINILKSTWHT